MKIDEIYNEINFVSQNKVINSLVLMITYECSMGCPYCRVIQKNEVISKESYKKAIELLFSSDNNEIHLKFFGGEPLLYPELILEIINYCESFKKIYPSKHIKYLITTNGLHVSNELLEELNKFNVEIMVSVDGDINTLKKKRPIKDKNGQYEEIFETIDKLNEQDITNFANILVTPSNVQDLSNNFLDLTTRGMKRIQVCYESGISWGKRDVQKLLEEFTKIQKFSEEQNIKFMNMDNEAEPVILSDEILVDVNGSIYYDIAIFHEQTFPELRNSVFLGDVFTQKRLQDLYHTKKEIFLKLIKTYSPENPKREIILNNTYIGIILKDFVQNYLKEPEEKTERKNLQKLLKSDVEEQINSFRKNKFSFSSYFLHIMNDCINNCIFCKNKKIPQTTLDVIEFKLKSNLKIGIKSLRLVGNEPLNHPYILEILDLCCKYGFNDIQVMASGLFVKDIEFVKELKKRNVKSFSLPIYSSKKHTHDKIVQREEDFDDLMKGLDNLQKLNLNIFLHTNLVKQNIYNINSLEKYVKDNITENFCILPVRCKYSNLKYENLIPSYTEMIQKLNTTSLTCFPLCVINQIQNNLFVESNKISDAIKIYLLGQNYIKHKVCKKCKYNLHCAGTFKEYVKLYGINEIEPFDKDY